MIYRLPEPSDKTMLWEYMEEYSEHGENDVFLEQDLFEESYDEWCEFIHHNAAEGNGEWGKSLLLLSFDESELMGILIIRFNPTPELERQYGNIGYKVRPSARRKSYAKKMLGHALEVCKENGMERVILGCHSDNPASIRVIESNGGRLAYTIVQSEDETNNYYEVKL